MVRLDTPAAATRIHRSVADGGIRNPIDSPRDPFETLLPGVAAKPRRIGSYRIVHPIAQGAMGQVFRAIHEATHETVALKIVRRSNGLPSREKDREFFLREMLVLSRLNHPRIVSVRDFGSADGQLFLAMEYVETIDLRRELLQCPTSRQVRLVCGVGCYMLAGLAHAHAQNIVHRDIKPANLLVYRNPDRGNRIGLKLADFGISKDVRNAGLSGMTGENEMRGTPAFMSPEHLQNSRDAGPSSDIYSTAAVLYYFLTGMVPHQQHPRAAVNLCRIIEEPPVPLSERRSDLSPQLCSVIDRGLAPVDEGRFETAVEFNQALIPFTRKDKGVIQ